MGLRKIVTLDNPAQGLRALIEGRKSNIWWALAPWLLRHAAAWIFC
jgi:hypothetical protein